MLKNVNSLLRLIIPLFLVLSTQPSVDKCDQNNVQSFGNASTMANFSTAILESTIGSIDLTHRQNHKSPDKSFQHALISDRISVSSKRPLLSIIPNAIDRFANKIWLQATATRAPPIFIL